MDPDNIIDHIAPEGHPVHTLMEEHAMVLKFTARLSEAVERVINADEESGFDADYIEILDLVHHLKESQKHYLREENVLFAYLEKHGINGPPRAMWSEHDQVRNIEGQIYKLSDNIVKSKLRETAVQLKPLIDDLGKLLETHFYKENHVLFPMALRSLTEDEWTNTVKEFAEIGYCCFSPKSATNVTEADVEKTNPVVVEDGIDLDTGRFTQPVLRAMMNTLPVDVTFVDKDDTFSYFNVTRHPIFVRTKSSLGLKVQRCHPQKSIDKVNKILADFKSGEKDSVDFWINMNNRLIYIRYFAVRDDSGEYLGCLEVMQDIKEIQQITGEKRLLDDQTTGL